VAVRDIVRQCSRIRAYEAAQIPENAPACRGKHKKAAPPEGRAAMQLDRHPYFIMLIFWAFM
jgi:hypothetical protein